MGLRWWSRRVRRLFEGARLRGFGWEADCFVGSLDRSQCRGFGVFLEGWVGVNYAF